MLPFASDDTLSKLEANISGLPAVTDVMAMGMTLERLTEVLLEGIGVDADHVSSVTPEYGPCDKEGLQVGAPTSTHLQALEVIHCVDCEQFHTTCVCPFPRLTVWIELGRCCHPWGFKVSVFGRQCNRLL